MGDKLGQVGPRRRLATRQMHLQHAELGGFCEHPFPGRGIELPRFAIEIDRIGADRDIAADSDG